MKQLRPVLVKSSFLVILTLFIFAVYGCASLVPKSQTVKKTEDPKYATGFKIEYLADGCKKVTDGEGRTLILVPRGQKPPAGYENVPKIETPVKKAVIFSTTQVALMKPLGVLDSIAGTTIEKDRWYIDLVKEGMEKGSIAYLGKGRTPDYEKLQALNPDVVFMWTKGDPQMDAVFKKLNDLDIPVAVNNEYLENHPLGRVEWIKFLAAFYDKDKDAEAFFNQVDNKVEKIVKKVAGAKAPPKVLWGGIYGGKYKGKVYVPNDDSYVAKMIAMAGGDHVFKELKGTGSSAVAIEEFYARGNDADVFISSTRPIDGVTSVEKLYAKGEIISGIKPIKEGKIWCFQDWYWDVMDKTDEQIEDLAAICYPELYPNYKLKHFLKLPDK